MAIFHPFLHTKSRRPKASRPIVCDLAFPLFADPLYHPGTAAAREKQKRISKRKSLRFI